MDKELDIKKLLLVIMIVSGFLFAQNEAYDALKVLEPYIGKWEIKEPTYGFFEGLPENTEIINSVEYKWITDRLAILETWEGRTLDGKQRINVGSILYTLDPATNSIKTKHFGYDGNVYWAGKGWIENKKNSLALHVEELTINGTHTTYTNELRILNKNTFQSQFIDINQGGKSIAKQPKRKFSRTK